ncbi:MAG: hypothetical protein IJ817_02595 [Clostridia bacterium]|nr:hypothetical protein [Clostridia bacterium]
MDNFDDSNNFYPKDIFYGEQKKDSTPSFSPFDAITKIMGIQNPLLSNLLSGKTLDQNSLAQTLSSMLSHQNTQTKQKQSIDDDFYEEH